MTKIAKFGFIAFALALAWTGASSAATVTSFVRLSGLCNDQKSAQTGSVVSSCSGAPSNSSVFNARASFGDIGAIGKADANGLSANGRSSASFTDEVTANIQNGTLLLAVDISGSFFDSIGGTKFTSQAGGFYAMQVFAGGNKIFAAEKSYSSSNNSNNPILISSSVNGSLGTNLIAFSIIGGKSQVSSSITVDAGCIGFSQCVLGADFFSSAKFVGGQVLDSNGQIVSNAALSSTSGFDYLSGGLPTVAAVPVPGGLLLLVSGLGAIATVRRRRTKQSIRVN